MKKIFIIIGIIIIIVIIAVLIFVEFCLNPIISNLNEDSGVLYSRSASWGPCPLGGGSCFKEIVIYNSGIIKEEPKPVLKKLTSEKIEEIKQIIRGSGIMDKTCEDKIMMDYGVNYEINLDGKEKTIYWPGCLQEINAINKAIGIKAEQSD